MADVGLEVKGKVYEGWKSVSITSSIESLAGSFELEIADQWHGQAMRWPIFEEDECKLTILDQPVITGWVDKRSMSLKGSSLSIKVSGRDRAGALVDCSAVLDKWTFVSTPLFDFVTKLAGPFGITVIQAPGEGPKLPPREKMVINPGDKVADCIEKAARMAGVLVISNGLGGLLITNSGTVRTSDILEEGVNILDVSTEFDFTKRYARYLVFAKNVSKIPKKEPDKKGNGAKAARAVRTRAEAFDDEVTRTERVLLINPEEGATKDYAQKRADWEAKTRAAKAEKATVTVHGWAQKDGKLWMPNQLVEVRAPRVGVAEGTDMLITECVYGLSASAGRTTKMTLKRKDAFTPEPRIPKNGGGKWPEKLDNLKTV